MTSPSVPTPEAGRDAPQESSVARLPYRKPQIEQLGDMRTALLGGSPGVQDSSNFRTQKRPGT